MGEVVEPFGEKIVFLVFHTSSSEILFDFNEGSSEVFKHHLISNPDRGAPPWADVVVPSRGKYSIW